MSPRFLSLVIALLGAATPLRVEAAVRVCHDRVETAWQTAADRTNALAMAMAAWIAAARRVGDENTAWRLAIDKSQVCLVGTDGAWRCQVAARPCAISQMPRPDLPRAPLSLPPGTRS